MNLSAFKHAPWKTTHPRYKESSLAISPAPEYASSEVLLASLYRTIGFASASEGSVPQAGKDMDKKIQKLRARNAQPPQGAIIDADTWNTMLHGILESPKLPNQSSKRFLQVSPLIPSLTLFSGSARLSSNSWPAGALIRRMISLGSRDGKAAQELWGELFRSLSISENDDIFARWLEQETKAWGADAIWALQAIPDSESISLDPTDFKDISFLPARQFTKDLTAIIGAKKVLTRRQWTSLLEATLRLASASHVAWLCDVQARVWRCLLDSLYGKGPETAEEARREIFPASSQYMAYGSKALNGLRDKASAYLTSRLGINTLLWSLEEINAPYKGEIGSSNGIAGFSQHIRDNRDALAAINPWGIFTDLRESEARALGCKKGIGSNLLEFLRHVLGQRQTADDLLRGYDQGYVLKKKGNSPSAPWVVSLGPVAVLAIVHCALAEMGGPRSIHRLGEHLAGYGIAVDRHDIARNDLGHQLRMLGLVLDSPDAESGMLLLPPFASAKQ